MPHKRRQTRVSGGLKVGRIAITLEDALDENPHLRPGACLVVPVDGGGPAHLRDQLMGNNAELLATHGLDGALILCQGIIERQLVDFC